MFVQNFHTQSGYANRAILFSVMDLIYWRQPASSGLLFGGLLLLQLSLILYSVISVFAYACLLCLLLVTSARFYYSFIVKSEENPFSKYLNQEIKIPHETSEKWARLGIDHLNDLISRIRSILLITNVMESFKFGILLYLLTYVGARFNFLTLCIVGKSTIYVLIIFLRIKNSTNT
ncbi:unnamed protein product [Protopolystoma xenopodis]|uniref:Reticulon-like protein n=1 Tax=Protopolystoma xenopodis TaxID=117903 RepID=A0A448X1E6_9PLAT|nr:unnamed protein product [Protopolystoma xenopodis]